MSSTIDRTVRIDDRDNNVKITLHEDPSVHAEKILNCVSVATIIEGDFHAAIKLGPQ